MNKDNLPGLTYLDERPFAEGGFAKVYRGAYTSHVGSIAVAVKVMEYGVPSGEAPGGESTPQESTKEDFPTQIERSGEGCVGSSAPRAGDRVGDGDGDRPREEDGPSLSRKFGEDVMQRSGENGNNRDRSLARAAKREADIMQRLKHPNVITYLMHHTGSVGGKESAAQAKYAARAETRWQTTLVTAFCIGGSLRQVLRDPEIVTRSKRINNAAAQRCIVGQIATGMSYLHSLFIVHGDLKASNVLLHPDLSRPSRWLAKIGDLGTANVLAPPLTFNTVARINGTVTHMAPELLREKRSSYASDVYAFAMVLWEIAAQGASAFPGVTPVNVIVAVVRHDLRPRFPIDTEPVIEQLAIRCWCADHAARPSFDDLVASVEREWLVGETSSLLASSGASLSRGLAVGSQERRRASNSYRSRVEGKRAPCESGCDSAADLPSDVSSDLPLSTGSLMSMEVSKFLTMAV